MKKLWPKQNKGAEKGKLGVAKMGRLRNFTTNFFLEYIFLNIYIYIYIYIYILFIFLPTLLLQCFHFVFFLCCSVRLLQWGCEIFLVCEISQGL